MLPFSGQVTGALNRSSAQGPLRLIGFPVADSYGHLRPPIAEIALPGACAQCCNIWGKEARGTIPLRV